MPMTALAITDTPWLLRIIAISPELTCIKTWEVLLPGRLKLA